MAILREAVLLDIRDLETALLDEGFVAVVSPLSADKDGQVLNINADSVAAEEKKGAHEGS